jgi:amino acid adenylation domain-containing protein
MSLAGNLKDLEAKGLELWLEGDRLRYRGPKEVLTPEILNELKQHKEKICTQLSESAREGALYPLSYNQRSLWFLHQLAPESAAYNVGFAVRIRSVVDAEAWRRAFQELLARHATLRTTFTKRGLEPVQAISRYQQVCFEQIEASHWDWPELIARVADAYKRPFNLEDGPVMRVNLFTRADDDHVLLLAVHHIVCDAWSLWLLLDEVRVFYSAQQQGSEASVPTPKLGYKDYIRWQNQMLAGPAGERLWAYWQSQMANTVPALNLPTDRLRPPVQTYNGSSCPFSFSAALTDRVRILCKAEGVTLYMTLVAAFQLLLHRYTGQEVILLGSPTTGRSQADFAGIVGDFMNPVVLRGSFVGNPGFKDLLGQVRQTVLDALAHQDFPFPLVVERLQLERDPSRSPIFQVMFNLLKPQRFPEVAELWLTAETGKQVEWGGITFESFPFAQQEGQLDLTVEMVERQTGLFGVIKYNADLFDLATIERMARHFEALLQGIVAHPEQRVSALPLLTEQEHHQMLVRWNQTKVDYPRDKCIHDLFEAQVQRTPEAIAVVSEDQPFTYRQLNDKADVLARRLKRVGVASGALVGLCVERSAEMLVAVLGIIKAGAAYLPLDPDHPKKRLDFILDDARATVLVTQPEVLAKLPFDAVTPRAEDFWAKGRSGVEGSTLRILRLNAREVDKKIEVEEHSGDGRTDNLAYVIYTSGSTGTPKGVQISHRAVVNFLISMAREPGMTAQDTMLAVTTLSFDIAALELLLPLTVGGRVVIAKREVAIDGLRLGKLLADSKATVMQATPATWRLMVESGWQGLSHLNILCGGEALPAELAQELLPRCGSLWNMYGPTEATIWSTTCRVTSAERITLGKPIANTEIYVLNEDYQPVPVGVPGELYIGGDGLAKGYLYRPELTAERFVRHPFNNSDGARLYKTGDIVACDADGQIRYIGRADHQVKIRGYRVELGEIERLIGRHAAGSQAVVVEREVLKGEKGLVSYIVASKEHPVRVAELRRSLQEELPDYMVPSRFVALEQFPLSPNGKIDRSALPVPEQDSSDIETTFIPPQTPTERILAEIWSTVLRIETVSVEDNLFYSGGHSLTCVYLSAEIYDKMGIRLPVSTILQHPTIRAIGRILDSLKTKALSTNDSQYPRIQDTTARQMTGEQIGLSDQKESELLREGLLGGIKNRLLQLFARIAPLSARPVLHRWRGVNIGTNVYIGYDAIIETARPWLVSIGNEAGVGIRSTIIAHFFGMEGASLRRGNFSVEIGHMAWVGPGVLILPNVKIGDGAVVAAGSTVTTSIPAWTFASGNPAKPVAKCGLPITQGVSYAEFISHLEPLEADGQASHVA